MYTYTYTGDQPTVFVDIQKNGSTWVPSKGDTIKVNREVTHPLLELVGDSQAAAKPAQAKETTTPTKSESRDEEPTPAIGAEANG